MSILSETFTDVTIDDKEYQRSIIDILVNSVFLYDDEDGTKLTTTYNLSQDNTRTIKISDLGSQGSPQSNTTLDTRKKALFQGFFTL